MDLVVQILCLVLISRVGAEDFLCLALPVEKVSWYLVFGFTGPGGILCLVCGWYRRSLVFNF